MNKVLSIFLKPYPFYIPLNRSIKMIIGFSIILPLYLLVFQPWNIDRWQCPYKTVLLIGMSVVIFVSLAANFYGVAKLFPKIFNQEKWTVGKEILWSLWNIMSILALNAVYWEIIPFCGTGIGTLSIYLTRSFALALLPSLFCFKYNQVKEMMLRLKKAEALNKVLKEKQGIIDNETIKLVGDNVNEKLEIGVNELLLIQADDNYSKIFWNGDYNLKKKMIRSSLKNLEKQISQTYIQRCHRSFIVNLNKVKTVTGNAKGYKLRLEEYPELIPVSRELSKDILNNLESLSH